MGTLTADQQRLPEQCEHKLPTSCRLTSIPQCCACADERAHAAAYSTYIDGVGYVLRGNRWQRYCWFCKEFWANRVDISGLRPAQTRIPLVPDQTSFLQRWYEFHQGYRVVVKEDGSEERIAVVGEDFRNVSPGHLPRTGEELRSGRERSEFEEQERSAETTVVATGAVQGPSLDEALDQMFDEASAEQTAEQNTSRTEAREETNDRHNNIHAQAMTIAERPTIRGQEYQARRTQALRRELHRMRNGIERVISGLRELGEDVPDQTDTTGRLTQLGNTLDAMTGRSAGRLETDIISSNGGTTVTTSSPVQERSGRVINVLDDRVAEAQEHLSSARRMRDQAARELETAEQELRTAQRRAQQLQREQRTAENYMRLFGTREEMAAQGENYVSPIGGLFDQAERRHRAAEVVRREERTLRQYLAEEEVVDTVALRRLGELQQMRRQADVWGVPQASTNQNVAPLQTLRHQGTSNTTRLMEMARDEVFTGGSDSNNAASDSSPLDSPTRQDTAERYMQQVYRQLRRQGWSQRMIDEYPPRAELHGDEEEQVLETAERPRSANTSYSEDGTSSTATDYRDNINQLDADIRFILAAIASAGPNSAILTTSGWTIERAVRYHREFNVLSPDEVLPRDEALRLRDNEELIWLVGLPADRMRRYRAVGSRMILGSDPTTERQEERRQNIEIMAIAYQISSAVRRRSGQSAMQQLQMLYRLQAGTRTSLDRERLLTMLSDQETVNLARAATESGQRESPIPTTIHGSPEIELADTDAVSSPSAIAEGLSTARGAPDTDPRTRDIAVAAGRRAMQTGPQGVMDRMMAMQLEYRNEVLLNEGRRTAQGLAPQFSGFLARPAPSESFESELDEEDIAVGLDAADSGRPEPQNDEDMTVKLECQICYSQFADTACLPCGHLVMCKWCSEQHSPTMMQDRTRPRRPAKCPVCRKAIKQKVRIIRA